MGPGKFVPNRRATAGTVGALIHRISINQQGDCTTMATKIQAQETREKLAGYIEGYLHRIMQPGQVTELRVLGVRERGFKNNYFGYFSDYAELAKHAAYYSGRATGVYNIMNPIHPALLGRAANRMERAAKDDSATADENIVSLNWLLIDVDPDKPDSKISATDAEKRLAEIKRDAIADYLTDRGWPEGIRGDSGNGAHIVYPIEQMENNSDNVGILQNCLQALHRWFDPAEVTNADGKKETKKDGSTVDQTVFNPARIWKLYGTLACKGDPIDDRPHRFASLGKDYTGIPETLHPVSLDLLSSLAADAPTPKNTTSDGNRTPYTGSGLEGEAWMDDWIGKHGIGATKKVRGYGVVWVLDQCPFNAEHTDRAAFITYTPGWGFGGGCKHNGCSGKGWPDMRAIYDGPKETRPKSKSGTAASAADYDGQDLPNIGDFAGRDLSYNASLTAFAQDDHGNAECLVRGFPNKYVFTDSHGWLGWNGQYWDRKRAELLLEADIVRVMQDRQVAIRANGDDPRGPVMPFSRNVNGTKNLVKSRPGIAHDIEDFDNEHLMLNCINGLVDLRDGQMHPHSPDQKMTHMIPVEYDSALVNDEKAWAWWHDWLSKTARGGADDAVWLRKAVGYSITGLTREEVLFYIYGPTRSGKGTFTETILAMLGHPLSTEVPFSTFTRKDDGNSQNHDLAPLKPARFIAASESNSYERFNEAKVKALTGGNDVRCAFKFKTHFNYRPQFKIWLSSNEAINADPDDDAVWGRVRVIEFPHSQQGNEDKGMKYRYRKPEALKAILAWAVRGALEWQRDGLGEPPSMIAVKNAQRAALDTVQTFLDDIAEHPDKKYAGKDTGYQGDGEEIKPYLYQGEDETIKTYADSWIAPRTGLYQSYLTWCKENGVPPKGQRGLTTALTRKGYELGDGKKQFNILGQPESGGKWERYVKGLRMAVNS